MSEPTITTAEQAAEAVVTALAVAVGGVDAAELVPMRRLFDELARSCGVELAADVLERVPEQVPAGELRARLRAAREELAREP